MKYPSSIPETNKQLHSFINVNMYELIEMCFKDIYELELFEDELRSHLAELVPDNINKADLRMPSVSATYCLASAVKLYAIIELKKVFGTKFNTM